MKMDFSNSMKISLLSLLLLFAACKKYGYNELDGYTDASENKADGKIDTNMKVVDRTLYAKARLFPGLVDDLEKRVGMNGVAPGSFTLNLNFSQQTAQILRISVAPTAQFSTGYYAAPGELVKIIVPPGIEGLTVQVGVHTDNLSGSAVLLRDPLIFTRKQLFAGENYIRNLYGGYIYVLASRSYNNGPDDLQPNLATFQIYNACVAPDFILGESNNVTWMAQVKASKVPWLELRSKRVIYTVPREFVVKSFTAAVDPLTDPTALMTEWNDIFERHYNAWTGLSDDAQDLRDRSPQGPWRGTVDLQISGYPRAGGHAGFPFMGMMTASGSGWYETWVRLNQLRTNLPGPNWGAYHEFGHNMQQTSTWEWSSLGESTNNLYSYKVAKYYGQDFKILHPPNNWNTYAMQYVLKGGPKNFETGLTQSAENGSFSRTVPFVQLLERKGYDWFTQLHRDSRRAERLSITDQAKRDFFYQSICNYLKEDLIPFFAAWGIQISAPAQSDIAAKFPLLNQPIWTYDIMEKTVVNSNVEFPVPLTVISSPSQNNATEAAANLVDGTVAYWQSLISGAGGKYPFDLVFSQVSTYQRLVPFKGISLSQRQDASTGYVRNIEIQISDDNVSYTSVGTTTVPQSTAKFTYIFPTGAKTAKYVRLRILTGVATTATPATNSTSNFVSLSEFGLVF